MISYKTETELEPILARFQAPKLQFVSRRDAGPDEELYFYRTKDAKNPENAHSAGKRYVLWSRDYMSELDAEARGLEEEFGLKIATPVRLKQPEYDDDYFANYEGDMYALFELAD